MGWMNLLDELSGLYKDSELGRGQVIEQHEFAKRLKGILTDHAVDQKLLW